MTPPSSKTPGSSGATITPAGPPPVVPDFTLARQIGRGSYGDVWLARDALGYWRALKVVRRDRFEQDAQYDREFTGISAYAPLSHAQPTLLRLLHVGRNDAGGYFYYAMELADGAGADGVDGQPSLAGNSDDADGATYAREFSPETYQPKTLRYVQRQRGRLPLAECLKIGRELVAALGHLHSRGLAHRDVKPSNVVFVRDEAKLADMGLVSSSDRTLTQGVGTAGYLAPEGGGTPAADFFALGKVLYELITGCDRMEFPKLPPLRDLPEIEQRGIRELNAVVLKACDPNPEHRYRTAVEFDGELLALEAGRSLDLQRRVVRQLKRAAAVLAVLALGGAMVGGWQWQRSQNLLGQERAGEKARLNAKAREKIIAQANALGSANRQVGWTTNAAAKLREAAALGPDVDVREAAAQLLLGVEARLHWFETNAPGSSLAWDEEGRRLLIGGTYPHNTNPIGSRTRLFDLRLTNCAPIMADRPGPVAWRTDQRPIQFRTGFFGTNGTNFYLYFREPGATNDLRRRIAKFGSVMPSGGKDPVLACCADGSRSAMSGDFLGTAGNPSIRGIWVCDTTRGDLLTKTNLHATALAFTPDGSLLAAGDQAGRVEVFSLPDFASLAVFETGDPVIEALAFGRDPLRATNATALSGWRLAAGSRATLIHVWELASRRQLARLRGSTYAVHSLAFSPDGALLASGGRNSVRLWDIANEQQILSLPGAWAILMDYVMALAFSPDGRYLAGTSISKWAPGCTWVAEIIPHRGVQPLYGLSSQIEQTWFSPDGRWLAALSHEWRLGVWEVATGRLRHVFLPPISGFPDNADLVFHPDGKIYFASGPEARVWDAESGEQVDSIRLGNGLGDHLRLLADGRVMLVRREPTSKAHGYDWTLRELRRPDATTPVFRQTDTDWTGYHGDVAPDGKYFAVTGETLHTNSRKELLVTYDMNTGAELWRTSLPDDPGTTRWVEFSADGTAVRFFREGETHSWHALANGAVVMAAAPVPSSFCSAQVVSGERARMDVTRAGSRFGPMALGLDYLPASRLFHSSFSADGTRMAWGTMRGIPLLAHLPELARQMHALGYEW